MALDREKFTQIVGMLGSSHEGEELAALRRANAMLQEAGVTWAEAVCLKTKTVTKVIEKVVVREVTARSGRPPLSLRSIFLGFRPRGLCRACAGVTR